MHNSAIACVPVAWGQSPIALDTIIARGTQALDRAHGDTGWTGRMGTLAIGSRPRAGIQGHCNSSGTQAFTGIIDRHRRFVDRHARACLVRRGRRQLPVSLARCLVRAGDTRIYVLLSHYLGVSLLAMDIAPFARGTQAFVFCYRTA